MSTDQRLDTTWRPRRIIYALALSQAQITDAFVGFLRDTAYRSKTPRVFSSSSDEDDFALIGLNANAPPSPVDISNTQASLFGLQSAEDIMGSVQEQVTPQPMRRETTQRRETSTGGRSENLSGLTDDGDFILEGVNAIDPMANKAIEKYGTPLQGAGSQGDFLAQMSLDGPQQQPLSKVDNLTGLTEDGDIALIGFNAVQPQNFDDNEIDKEKLSWSFLQDQSSYFEEAKVKIAISVERPEPSLEEIDGMTIWLQDLIPTLRDEDCILYAEQLVALGFHPECLTRFEIQEEDLEFMKPLHSRYFMKAIRDGTT